MRKHISTIIIIVLFVVGLLILLYPSISNYINEKNGSKVISQYNEATLNTNQERIDEMFREAEEYNQKLAKEPSAFYNPQMLGGYEDVLDITGTGIMGYIDIDRIEVELPIYHGVDDSVLQIGAGHLEGTSLPVGGESTHAVLSGHRGLPSAKLFTDLNEMEEGDIFYITILDRKFTYRVDQIKTILPTETDDLRIVEGKDYCTLMTCTPYGINTHRLLVRGERIENEKEMENAFVKNEAFRIDPLIVTPIIAIPILLILLILVIIRSRLMK